MKASPWITYRTRFLVKAKQLGTSLTFTDMLGRQHSGRKGDYLVESSDGVLRIAPRQIFEDIYVPLLEDGLVEAQTETSVPALPLPANTKRATHSPEKSEVPPLASYLARKSPQPDHGRGNEISHSL